MVVFELDAYPEPKALKAGDLEPIYRKLGTIVSVSAATGLAWAAVQERMRPSRRWSRRRKKFEPVN